MRLYGSAPNLRLAAEEISEPRPARAELLIRVVAAGVTRTELQWYPTTHLKTGQPRTAAIPVHEFSGIIVAAGEDAGELSAGAEVYGMNDWFADGALAEFCVALSSGVTKKPRTLSHVEAASVPIGALTAWQGLFDQAGMQPGERVLVQGGAGSVGIFAVQLAKLFGAHVTSTASAANAGFVRGLGADVLIDYKARRFEDEARNIDVVFDTVGGETLARSWSVLKPGGRMVTIVSIDESSADARTRKAFFIVRPSGRQLAEVTRLIDAGRLRPAVDAVVPLSRAEAAYEGKVERKGRGKIVIAVANEEGEKGTERNDSEDSEVRRKSA
jgi:NADPH:quinone reductase-like Zn-dependent oxidoreductase